MKRSCGKESTEVWLIQKNRKRKGKLLPENEETSGQKSHANTNTWKLNEIFWCLS